MGSVSVAAVPVSSSLVSLLERRRSMVRLPPEQTPLAGLNQLDKEAKNENI